MSCAAEQTDGSVPVVPKGRWRPGTLLSGTYRVGELIGTGGTSEVYEARHVLLDRLVAIKVLKSEFGEEPQDLHRFQREARSLAALCSDHIVGVYDCRDGEEGPYLVMERLLGVDLKGLLAANGSLTVARTQHLGLGACRGLARMHEAGLVHRDLKPANLFVTRTEDGGERCKILDLGVAKLATSAVTRRGTLIGTVRYMAPEQLSDDARVSPATDVYALCAVLYECLTGSAPHAAESVQETMYRILNEPITPIDHLNRDVPPALNRVLLQGLRKEPKQRYKDAAELLRAFETLWRKEECTNDSSTVRDTTFNEVGAKARRRAWRSLAVGATGVLALGALLRPAYERANAHSSPKRERATAALAGLQASARASSTTERPPKDHGSATTTPPRGAMEPPIAGSSPAVESAAKSLSLVPARLDTQRPGKRDPERRRLSPSSSNAHVAAMGQSDNLIDTDNPYLK